MSLESSIQNLADAINGFTEAFLEVGTRQILTPSPEAVAPPAKRTRAKKGEEVEKVEEEKVEASAELVSEEEFIAELDLTLQHAVKTESTKQDAINKIIVLMGHNKKSEVPVGEYSKVVNNFRTYRGA